MMTLYVGIDVAKHFHVVAVVDPEGEVLHTRRIENDAAGYSGLDQLLGQYERSGILISLESTGHYGHALRDWLLRQGYQLHIFNPLKTNRFRDFYIQWHKNDERDAIALAHLLRLGERQPYYPLSSNLRRLRQMVRHRALLVQTRARTKNQIRAILDEVFPEYQAQTLFSDLFGITSLALLSRYPTPAQVADLDEAELTALLRSHSQGRLGLDRARLIQQLAAQSIGSLTAGQAYAAILPAFITGYRTLSAQIKQSTEVVETYLAQTNQTLTSIPGVGSVLAATILAEVGDVQRFPSANHLVAFCGLALSEAQSGQARPRRFLSRRGSARLRGAFFQAALVAVNFDPHLRAYYQRRTRQGLAKRPAILTVARKLVRICYALLKSGQAYSPPSSE
jgi:transposase